MANPEHLRILKQGVEVWNRWREENPKISPDLSGTELRSRDFRGMNLKRASFKGSDLRDTKMQQADLRNADLRQCYLSRTDLTGATLQGANLIAAILTGTILKQADLSETNLKDAKLRWLALENTDFSNAKFGYTIIGGVDLRKAKGVSTIAHDMPSTMGIDTLSESQGDIPEMFLRRVGLPERIIELTPTLFAASAIELYSCFISYSHSEKSFARRLHDQLQARGIRCWLDDHDLKPGDRILDGVADAIRLHDKILLCCSESSLNSWWVKDEIEKALERERKEARDIIIPLNLDGYLLDGWESGLATTIRSRLAADFTGWEHDNAKFEEQFKRVVRALRTDEGGREKPPEPKL